MEPKDPPSNLDETSESESKASEKPHPTGKVESVVEPPASVTRQKAAKEDKKRKQQHK